MFCACCAASATEAPLKEAQPSRRRPETEEPVGPVSNTKPSAERSNLQSTSNSKASHSERNAAEMWVTFDAIDFKIKDISAALNSLLGPVPSGHVALDLVGGDDLRRAVQQSINELCNLDDAPRHLTIKHVPVKSIDGAREFQAMLTLDFGDSEESVELDMFVIEGLLSEMKELDAEAKKALQNKKKSKSRKKHAEQP